MELNTSMEPSAAAPGCYAAPSVFSQDSDICRSCPAFDACAQACIQTLQNLRDTINVDSLLARHRGVRSATIEAADQAVKPLPNLHKFMPSVRPPANKVERKVRAEPVSCDMTAEDEAIVSGLNKNSRELATKWIKRGLIQKIRDDMNQGRNPFAAQDRLDHCSVVCSELLKGTVTKQSLIKAFMSQLGAKSPWDKSTASSHVGIAMPVLVAFGIAQETSEGWVVTPQIGGDNV
jgi:hypothetical protein